MKLIAFLKKKNITVALITGKGEKSCTITLEKLGLSEIYDEILYGSEISPNKKENMEYLLKKYSISKEKFCYIGDTVQDIKDCQEVGVICFSAAWQESSNADILEKENPNHVFYCVNDLYEYFIPDLRLPTEEEQPIGTWGQRHLDYLKQYRKVTYTNLLTSGKLSAYLANIDRQAQDITKRLKEKMP